MGRLVLGLQGGRHPFDDGTRDSVYRRIAAADLPDIREFAPQVHAGVAEFLRDRSLSGSATDKEMEFLEGLRFTTGRPTALAATEYLLLSKRTRQVLETDAGTAWKPSNRPA